MQTSFKNKYFGTARSSKCSVTAALLSMLVGKTQFQRRNWKYLLQKSKFCPEIFFLSGLVQNKLKLYVFEMDFMTIQLKMTVPKKYGFPSWKGSNIWSSDHCFEVQNTILKVLFRCFSTRQRHITSYSPNRSPCSIFTEFFFQQYHY